MKTKSNKEILKELVDSLDEKDIKEVLSRFNKEETKEDKIKKASDFMFEILRETTCNILGEKELIFYDKNGQ
jgi:TPP-dependent 2-oxoacid decarboxylase